MTATIDTAELRCTFAGPEHTCRICRLADELDRLRAENERLRAALKMAVIWGSSMAEAPDPARPVWFDMARDALEGK
jgi:hypothetical protein